MHPQKVAFLFGELDPGADPDAPDQRNALLARGLDLDAPGAPLQLALRSVVANQIADEDPPEVWRTAQRLLAGGLDPASVLGQLMLTLTPLVHAAVEQKQHYDPATYVAALERLPLPSTDAVRDAMLQVARSRRSVSLGELNEQVAARLGLALDDPVVELLLDRVGDEVLGPDGPLEMLSGDRVVHVEAVLDGVVLTHRLTPAERDLGVLPVDVDLAGFRRRTALTTAEGDRLTVADGQWTGPSGWLTGLAAGDVLAVRVRDDVVSLTPLATEPDVDHELAALIRAGYDEAVAEPWLPVPVEELVMHAVLTDPEAFGEPRAPLSRLLAAAELEVRGTEVAHEQSVWDSVEQVRRIQRLFDRTGTGEFGRQVVEVLGLLDEQPLTTATARQALDELADPAVLEVVAGELFGEQDDADLLQATESVAQRLRAAASQPLQRAVAHWLLAVVAERQQRVLDAELELREAVRADPLWPCAVDRLAWYRADRGDAAGALELWSRLGVDAAVSADVRLLGPQAAPAAPSLGRNDRCWCGSGRKFKQCHLGSTALPPLPERVGWLCRKAGGYLERRGGAPGPEMYEHALALAADPDDPTSVDATLDDPLLTDVVLHEAGWFTRFLDERGALLPEDELLLARAWTLMDRTVYDVTEVRPGTGLTVRDLRTGDTLDVRERTFSRQAQAGQLVCARAVPDGQEHQFIGGLFLVPPGRERDLLELLDRRDGLELLEYVAALHRPPVVVGPDGQVLDLGELGTGAAPVADGPQVQEAMLSWLADQEQRWCVEAVPALDGLTPAQAAADPTRRDDLIRLIDSFPTVDPASGAFALRPERLRELLDLPARP